jgi:autotransporter translocation and assembly factor TamB
MGEINKIWLLEVTERSPELKGKVALRIQVGKKFRGDNPTTSKVKSTTVPLTVFIRPLSVRRVTTGQTT